MSNHQTIAKNDSALYQVSMSPAVDIIEDASGITLYADLPGVPKENLKLQIEGDALTIDGIVRLRPSADDKTHDAEENQPRYHRAFTLSDELDAEHVVAEFSRGVLKLQIPKAAQAQPKHINVTVN